MNEVIDNIFLNTKKAYKESMVIDNDELQDLLIEILTDAKKLQKLCEGYDTNRSNKNTDVSVSKRYTYEQVKAITKIQLELAKELITIEAAGREILKIAASYPIQHLSQYNKRIKNCLVGIGTYGFAFPSNWAKALLEETNNNELVIKAFKHQQKLYFEKDGRTNKKLEILLNNL